MTYYNIEVKHTDYDSSTEYKIMHTLICKEAAQIKRQELEQQGFVVRINELTKEA